MECGGICRRGKRRAVKLTPLYLAEGGYRLRSLPRSIGAVTQETDAPSIRNRPANGARCLARLARVERRCGLRALSAVSRHDSAPRTRTLSHGVLSRPAPPQILEALPLLLTIR